jgi:TraM recognition site of TraD and TraG/Type IV secretory system Conjugative DNA transfer
MTEGQAVEAVQAPAPEAGVMGLGQWAGDHAGTLLLALAALMVLFWLRLRWRRRDPLAGAARQLWQESARHGHKQGRVSAAALTRALPLEAKGQEGAGGEGIPLGYAPPLPARPWRRRPTWRCAGVPWDADLGHVLVVAPSRSGKSFHATDTLLRFPGPVVAVDPKGELWQRTAGARAGKYGPAWRIPEAGVDLARLFDLSRDLDRREVFQCLWRPWQDGADGRIFTERTYPLLAAAVATGRATGGHPLALLARWARMAPGAALAEAAPHAPAEVAVLTDGTPLDQVDTNRFFLSSWGTFSTKFGPFAEHVRTLSLAPERGGVPQAWAREGGTVYLTYPLHAQGAVGPLAAALVAGLLRDLQAHPPGKRALLLLDEAPAVGLPHLSTYLATIGGAGAGCTAVVYSQSLAALEAVYGQAETESIVSNASFQVFAAPRNLKTAQYLSELMGDELEVVKTSTSGATTGSSQHGYLAARTHSSGENAGWSVSSRYRRFLSPTEATAIPRGEVAVFALGYRARLYDSRTVWAPWLDRLPPPPGSAGSGAAPPGPGHHPPGPQPAGAAPVPVPAPPAAAAPPARPGGQPGRPGETAPPAAAGALW